MKMNRVLRRPGDGIGSEVERPVGSAEMRSLGVPCEPDLVEFARTHDAIMVGAVP
jgi:hypothetical protein